MDRSEYYKYMYARKKESLQNDSFVNPSDSNDFGQYAEMQTEISAPIDKNSLKDKPKTTEDTINFYQRTVDTVGAVQMNLAEGVLNFFDSLVDFGFNTIDAIGGGVEWAQKARDYDWQAPVIAMSNLNVMNPNIYKEDYWKTITDPKLAREYIDTAVNKSNFVSEVDELNNFMTSVEQSIGFMLPSIAIGGLSASSESLAALGATPQVASKVGALGTMFLGAGSSGANEAYIASGDYGKALAVGVLKGGLEVGTELFSNIIFPNSSSVMGVFGDKTVTLTKKEFIKSLGSEMLQEGIEEAESALVEPFINRIYDKNALSDTYGKPMEYFFGANGKFNESVLGQGISGSVTGGILGGISQATFNNTVDKKIGKENRIALKKYIEMENYMNELLQSKDAKNLSAEGIQNKYAEELGKYATDFLEASKKANFTEEQKRNFVEMIQTPDNFIKDLEKASKGEMDALVENIANASKNINEVSSRKTFSNLMEKVYNNDTTIEFGDVENSYYDEKENKIVIDKKYQDKFAEGIAHEAFMHAVFDALGIKGISPIYNRIINTKFGENLLNQVKKQYANEITNDDGTIDEFKLMREVTAHFVQSSLRDTNLNTIMQNKVLEDIFLSPDMERKLKKYFDKDKSLFKNNTILKDIARIMRYIPAINVRKNLLKSIKAKITNNQSQEKQGVMASKDIDYNGDKSELIKEYPELKEQIQNGTLKYSEEYIKSATYEDNNYMKALNSGDIQKATNILLNIADKKGFISTFKYNSSYLYHGVRNEKNKLQGQETRFGFREFNDEPIFMTVNKEIAKNTYAKMNIDDNESYHNYLFNKSEDMEAKGVYSLFVRQGTINNKKAYVPTVNVNGSTWDSIPIEYAQTLFDRMGQRWLYNKFIDYIDDADTFVIDSLTQFLKKNSKTKLIRINKINGDGTLYDGTSTTTDEVIAFDKKFVKNAELISFDKNKNIIPPSKRFDTTKTDIMFSKGVEYSTASKTENEFRQKYAQWSKEQIISMKTSKDIAKNLVQLTVDTLSDQLGGALVKPRNYDKYIDLLKTNVFDDKNFDAKKVDDIVKIILGMEYDVHFDGKDMVQKLKKQDVNKFKEQIKEIINSLADKNLESTKLAEINAKLEKFVNEIRNMKSLVRSTREYTKLNNKILSQFEALLKPDEDGKINISEDDIVLHSTSLLLSPFRNLPFDNKTAKFGSKKLYNDLKALLDKYQPDIWDKIEIETDDNGKKIKINKTNLPYNPAIRQALLDIYNSISVDENGRHKSLDSVTLDKINDTIRLIYDQYNKANERVLEDIRPTANQTKDIVVKRWGNNAERFRLINRLFGGFAKEVASAYYPVRYILGDDSSLADLITVDMSMAESDAQLYEGDIKTQIFNKVKELKVGRLLNKKVKIQSFTKDGRTITITYGRLLDLYLHLNTTDNFDEIEKCGYVVNEDDFEKTLVSSGTNANGVSYAQLAKEWFLDENNFATNLKAYANFLKELMNGKIRNDYIEWYKNKNNGEPNEIKDYWEIHRESTRASKVDFKSRVPLFERALSRSEKASAPIRSVDATNVVLMYAKEFSKEQYIRPLWEKFYDTLNTQIAPRRTLLQQLEKTIGYSNIKYLMDVVDGFMGKNNKDYTDWMSFLSTGFALKSLSFNIGSMMKQYLSMFTSNLPMSKSFKGTILRVLNNKLITSDKALKAEFDTLVDTIGALKYRNLSGASQAELNTDTLGILRKPAEFGMGGMSFVDYFTMTSGIMTLMFVAKSQGYEYNTKENIEFVKEHWNEFQISQIARNTLALNNISRGTGKLGALGKFIFGIMQGANRVAVASNANKLQMWQTYRKVNKAELEQQVKDYEESVKKATTSYKSNKTKLQNYVNEQRANGATMKDIKNDAKYQKLNQRLVDAEKKLVEEKTKQVNAETKLKRYKEFEIMGGAKGTIPNVISGLIAQGLFVTLINELMKHIKGKKDWDDWEFINDPLAFGTEIMLNSTVGIIPVVNVIFNKLVKGYDVEVASAVVIEDILSIGQTLIEQTKNLMDGQELDTRDLVNSLIKSVSGVTGMPIENLGQYTTGIVRLFDPETAIEMRNVFYGYSYNSQLNAYKQALEDNKPNTAMRQLNVLLDSFKVNSSDKVKNELNRLYQKGENALPSNYITQYKENNGVTKKLTTSQINDFRATYNISDRELSVLIGKNEYKKLDDSEKAKVVKKIYDTYHDYAKAKATKGKGNSKLSNLLLYSKGNINISSYVLYLNQMNMLTDTRNKSRKENVIDYVNKLSGLSKDEKLLLLYLGGYSSKVNTNRLRSYLIKKRISRKDVDTFLKLV